MIDDSMMLRSNDKALRGKPTSVHYWFHFARVILCLDVSRGQSVLTRWTSVLHESTKTSDVTQTMASPPRLHPSLSHCLNVIWQTKRLFIQSRNKTQHPPFTLRLSNTPSKRCHLLKNMPVSSLSLFFFLIIGGRELLTPDQRGYHSKHGRDPNPEIHPVCVCVKERVCMICAWRPWKSPLWLRQCA